MPTVSIMASAMGQHDSRRKKKKKERGETGERERRVQWEQRQ
jgi:hypothetical protein